MLTRFAAMALDQEGPSSTGLPLLDQPFIFTNVLCHLDSSDKRAMRLVCVPLRLAVDEQVASLALLDDIDDAPSRQPADPSFFKAGGQRGSNVTRIALSSVVDVKTLLSRSKYRAMRPSPSCRPSQSCW